MSVRDLTSFRSEYLRPYLTRIQIGSAPAAAAGGVAAPAAVAKVAAPVEEEVDALDGKLGRSSDTSMAPRLADDIVPSGILLIPLKRTYKIFTVTLCSSCSSCSYGLLDSGISCAFI